MKYVIGVDIGGTFTDIVCLDEEGKVKIEKVPSTPADPSLAMMDGIAKLASSMGKNLKEFFPDVLRICHGTTVSTNTILTGSGAKVGLLGTKGFRDILEIRFGIRENVYDYTVPQPKALAPRYLRMPIEERVKWNGEEVIPLNEDDVRKACKYLKQQGVEAVAVCFIWSFKNPSHERRAVEICKEELSELYVCGSCDVQPEIREYWRMSTTVINAYVGPALSRYIKHLVNSLEKAIHEAISKMENLPAKTELAPETRASLVADSTNGLKSRMQECLTAAIKSTQETPAIVAVEEIKHLQATETETKSEKGGA